MHLPVYGVFTNISDKQRTRDSSHAMDDGASSSESESGFRSRSLHCSVTDVHSSEITNRDKAIAKKKKKKKTRGGGETLRQTDFKP